MAATRFQLGKQIKSGRVVMLVISHKGKERFYYTGLAISDRDKAKGKVRYKPQLRDADILNSRLEQIQDKVTEIFRSFKFANHEFTLDQVCELFEQWYRPDKFKSLDTWQSAFDAWIVNLETVVKNRPGTVRAKKVLKQIIEGFSLTDATFTERWIDLFLNHLIEDKNYEPTYVLKRITHLKEFVRFCQDKGINLPADALTWKPKRRVKVQEKEPIYIYPEEYQQILNANLSGHLDKIRDCAVILWNVAQHYEDARTGALYGRYFEGHRAKTGNRFKVAATDELIQVLAKYDGKFPKITNQKLNDGLKELFAHLGIIRGVKVEKGQTYTVVRICDIVSTKMFRKGTSTVLATAGMHPKALRDILGHSNLSQQDDYISTEGMAEEVRRKISGK